MNLEVLIDVIEDNVPLYILKKGDCIEWLDTIGNETRKYKITSDLKFHSEYCIADYTSIEEPKKVYKEVTYIAKSIRCKKI
jgi:hypothetical protein